MAHYAAFDVSDKETAIHVLDEHGRLVWKGKRASEPEVLATALQRHAPELQRVGLETGQLAPWLYHSLKALGVPVCQTARNGDPVSALNRGSDSLSVQGVRIMGVRAVLRGAGPTCRGHTSVGAAASAW